MIPTNDLIARYRQGELSASWVLALATSRHPDIELLEDLYQREAMHSDADQFRVWVREVESVLEALDDNRHPLQPSLAVDELLAQPWPYLVVVRYGLERLSPSNVLVGLLISDITRAIDVRYTETRPNYWLRPTSVFRL